jgi:hypothetical protein
MSGNKITMKYKIWEREAADFVETQKQSSGHRQYRPEND